MKWGEYFYHQNFIVAHNVQYLIRLCLKRMAHRRNSNKEDPISGSSRQSIWLLSQKYNSLIMFVLPFFNPFAQWTTIRNERKTNEKR